MRFQNYCGIGVDAQIVLQFHEMRNENPHIFFHRWVNKLWYGLMGWEQIWKKSCSGFRDMVSLYVDGQRVVIPGDCEGVVFCNILSYGGGSRLWVAEVSLDGSNKDIMRVDCKIRRYLPPYVPLQEEGSPVAAEEEDIDLQGQFFDDDGNSLRNSTDNRRYGQHWQSSSMNDGIIEILAVRGSLELAQVRLGLASCRKLAQGRDICLQVCYICFRLTAV